jgi:hypothetical protein
MYEIFKLHVAIFEYHPIRFSSSNYNVYVYI